MNIMITDTAKSRLEGAGLAKAKYLRLSVKSGGCSGMTYDATIVDDIPEGEEIIQEIDDIRVVSDQRSSLFLEGLTVDYSTDLISGGFQLTNPNSSNACGCGASFSV